MKTFFHGEVVIVKANKIPYGVKKVSANNKCYILAYSETTGNHHLLEEKDGCELFEKDGILYLKNDVPVDVFCAVKERHDNITLEPGIWEIDKAQEYDFLREETRAVSD